MSHQPLRKEKNCLNCGAHVEDRFCSHCGQENKYPQETVRHFVGHFISDILHFEGNFWLTLKKLFTRPGFLSQEYVIGRRVRYLNPVKMYLFTSFIFFFIFFSVNKIGEEEFHSATSSAKLFSAPSLDSARLAEYTATLNKGVPMTTLEFKVYRDSTLRADSFTWDSNKYKSIAEYDSLLRAGELKDHWLRQKRIRKQIAITEKYGPYGSSQFLRDFLNSLLHSFPQILFISLPLVALLFQMLYHRHKKYYYVAHAIFTIHFYITFFIVMLFGSVIDEIEDFANVDLGWMQFLLFVGLWFYLYKAMRRFYQQSRWKTFIKLLLFFILFFLVMAFLIVVFSLKSWLTV